MSDEVSKIRLATHADVSAVERVVREAYTKYVGRIGKPPGPMLDDYRARIAEQVVWVKDRRGRIAGLVVLLPMEDHLLLDNIAIDPAFQGQGLGRALMEFSEAQAHGGGFPELRLYTHQLMQENIALYARSGWIETGRTRQDGYDRVFFRKPVARSA